MKTTYYLDNIGQVYRISQAYDDGTDHGEVVVAWFHSPVQGWQLLLDEPGTKEDIVRRNSWTEVAMKRLRDHPWRFK